MKIKHSKENISLDKLPKIFIISVCVAVLLRTVQLFAFIDHETGFYKGGTVLTVILYVLLFGLCLYFGAMSYFSCESKSFDIFVKRDNGLVAATVAMAIGLLYDAVSALGLFASADGISYSGNSAFQSMMLSGMIPSFFRSIFAVLSGVYFIILAKGFLKEDERAARHKYLALAPVGWAGFRLIYRFVEQISYIRVSELLLELILLAGMITFFMALAQVASGVYSTDFRWRMSGIGLPAALMSLTVSCSRLILTIVKGSAINGKYAFEVSDLLFGIFVLMLVKAILNNKKEVEE